MESKIGAPMHDFLFYLFSAFMLFSALMAITSRSPVNSAVFLVVSFFCMSGLFVLLGAYFLAAIQVLVYAGAIMVLFLFVIMLLNIKSEQRIKTSWFGIGAALVVGTTLISEFLLIIRRSFPAPLLAHGAFIGTTEAVGRPLFTRYLLPFEVTSLILLLAMIGVIILSKPASKS